MKYLGNHQIAVLLHDILLLQEVGEDLLLCLLGVMGVIGLADITIVAEQGNDATLLVVEQDACTAQQVVIVFIVASAT